MVWADLLASMYVTSKLCVIAYALCFVRIIRRLVGCLGPFAVPPSVHTAAVVSEVTVVLPESWV